MTLFTEFPKLSDFISSCPMSTSGLAGGAHYCLSGLIFSVEKYVRNKNRLDFFLRYLAILAASTAKEFSSRC